MNDIPSTIFIGLGAVVAAIITGFITFINLVISKDQKTSEFRQEWINSIRNDISNYLGQFAHLHSIYLHTKGDKVTYEVYVKEGAETMQRLHSLFTQISLRLNPKEHNEFIAVLKELDDLSTSPSGLSQRDKILELNTKITSMSQEILKDEWLRVKTGEPSYIKIKKYLKIFTTLCIIAVIILAVVA